MAQDKKKRADERHAERMARLSPFAKGEIAKREARIAELEALVEPNLKPRGEPGVAIFTWLSGNKPEFAYYGLPKHTEVRVFVPMLHDQFAEFAIRLSESSHADHRQPCMEVQCVSNTLLVVPSASNTVQVVPAYR